MNIILNDKMSLNDKISDKKIFNKMQQYALLNSGTGPLGWVKIFMQKNKNAKKELIYEDHNMIVAQGRYFVAQRIFNFTDNVKDYRNYNVSHFAIGGGGATINGDNVTLLGPNVCDTSLYKPITLNSTHNEPGNFDNGDISDDLKDIYTYVGAVKPISSLKMVTEEYEDLGTTCAYKTKMKCECVVAGGEPSTLTPDGYIPISEAGLYMVNGSDAQMFAHVCFAPKYKELDSVMTIEWYILC